MFVDDVCYTINVGDSRSFMSAEGGKYTIALSRDHKPNDELEKARIEKAGGKIYQTQTVAKVPINNTNGCFSPRGVPTPSPSGPTVDQIIVGPFRVHPGRLSVSRTFGDIEAKRPFMGGNPNVIIATPEIKSFNITEPYDYVLLACKQLPITFR